MRAIAQRIFDRLLAASGPRKWWGAPRAENHRQRDEVIIGAVLTQNTSWKNVEKALDSLQREKLLDLGRLAQIDPSELAPLLRSSGYFNLKARRLNAVARFFAPGGKERFEELALWDDAKLREALLGVYGVGPETADSILLYALDRPSFVIDAYTLRVGRRHGLFGETASYDEAREWFSKRFPADVAFYNEFHALLDWVGNRFCKPTPLCKECPLARRDCCADASSWKAIRERVVAAKGKES